MSVRIRLKRLGRRNHAFYRICAFDNRTRRDGRAIEYLGHYDPHVADETKKYSVNKERVEYWLSVGAEPSDTCKDILVKQGIEVRGCTKKVVVLTPEQIAERKQAKEEKARRREEAQARKAIAQPKKLSKKELRAAKRAGG